MALKQTRPLSLTIHFTRTNSVTIKVVGLCPSLLVSLLRSSSSKELGLLMTSVRLKLLKIAKRETKMKIVWLRKNSPQRMVNNKQLMSTAATLHWTLPFCIAPCSVELFGSVVRLENLLELEFDDDEA